MAKTLTIDNAPKLPWLETPDKFEKFYFFIRNGGMIPVISIDSFASHYTISNQDFKEPIIWLKSKTLFANIFYELQAETVLLTEPNFPKLLSLHFCEPDGKNLNSQIISTHRSNGMSKDVRNTINLMFKKMGIER